MPAGQTIRKNLIWPAIPPQSETKVMSSRKRKTNATRQATSGKKRGRKPSREGQAASAKMAEVMRQGTPGKIQAHLAERERRGEIVVFTEEEDLAAEDFMDEGSFDAEIDLEDDDFNSIEELDHPIEDHLEVGFCLNDSTSFDSSDKQISRFEIRIGPSESGRWRCELLRPGWMRGSISSDDAESDLDNFSMRLSLLESIADWLTEKRQEFLNRPQPQMLVVDALEEMYAGDPSALANGFLRRSGIDQILVEAGAHTKKTDGLSSFFSRLASEVDLVWSNGRMPLNFLFSHEVRMAWVASAVRQFIERELNDCADLKSLAKVNPRIPRDRKERERLAGMHTSSLTLAEFIPRCCLMAGKVSWQDVLSTQFNQSAGEHK